VDRVEKGLVEITAALIGKETPMILNSSKKISAFVLGAFVTAVAAAPVAAASWPDHVAQAQAWINVIKADNNDYGDSPSIGWIGADLHARSRCGSFTGLLLQAAYPGAITGTVLNALTGESLPHAANWYQAILSEALDPVSHIGFHRRDNVADIASGDILAASYALNGDTGHAMTVASIISTGTGIAPPYTIPNVPTVNRYRVAVYDSTKSPHGSYASNPYPDTRYLKQLTQPGVYVDDQGIGSGTIVLYEDPATGDLVAWAWNVSTTTSSFYYVVPRPAGSSMEERPMVAGYLSGPGL
jgi:hypothetical protein